MSKLKSMKVAKRQFDYITVKLYQAISKITVSRGSKLLECFLKWNIQSDIVIVK